MGGDKGIAGLRVKETEIEGIGWRSKADFTVVFETQYIAENSEGTEKGGRFSQMIARYDF